MGKRRDPTMKRPQEGGGKGGEGGTLLEEKYKKLEQHWDTCKQPNQPPKVLDRRCWTGSSSSISVDQLFNKYSPRELMSSLQAKHRGSPPSEGSGNMMMFNSKVRANDDMLVELLRDRLSAIQSGKLKGRRLFLDSDDADEDEELDGDEISSDCSDLIINRQSEQVKSVVSSSYASDEIINDGCTSGGISKEDGELCSPTATSSTSSSSVMIISNEKIVEREKTVVAVERENNVISVAAGGRVNIIIIIILPAAMAWLCIVLMLFVMWMSCNRWYVGEDDDDVEVFLVPT